MISRWLTTLDDFAALAPQWDAAVEAANRPVAGCAWGFDNPFLLSEVLLTWSRTFLRPEQVRVWTCRDNGRLIGGLPLFLTRRRHGLFPGSRRGVSWAALHAMGLGFVRLTEPFWLGDPEAFSPALAASLRELPGWTYLALPQLRAPLLEGAATGRPRLRRIAPVAGTGARITLDRARFPSADAYLAARGREPRTKIPRLLRRARQLGPVEFVVATAPATVEELIDFQLHHNGPFRYPPEEEVGAPQQAWADFIRSMLRILLRRGWLDAIGLRIGGEWAASGFGFRRGPGHKSLMTAYDPRFRRQGPGFLLFYHLIDWCLANGDPYIDLYAGEEEFEQRWCAEFPPRRSVWVFNRTWAGEAMYWGGRCYLPRSS